MEKSAKKQKRKEDKKISRHFENPFGDYVKQDKPLLPLDKEFEQVLYSHIQDNVELIKKNISYKDYSIYTGSGGICFMFLRLYEKTDDSKLKQVYFNEAMDTLLQSLKSLKARKSSRVTFLCGGVGLYALAAVLYHIKGDKETSAKYVDAIKQVLPDVLSDDLESDEFLYGRAGYLYALLFVAKYLGEQTLADVREKVARLILSNGKKIDVGCPLMYSWHGKTYLAAAHGVAGILHTLLYVPEILKDSAAMKDIKATIDFVAKLKFASGNYPTRVDGTSDELVQWCHGAPAMILLFCKAYEVFKDEKYLNLAKEASAVVWKRGLLKKGCGLCHGISGNAYSFLILFKYTKDEKYYWYAMKFCEFSWGKEGKEILHVPDEPYSLFGGIGGAVFLYLDMLSPDSAKFPCFHL